MLRRLAQAGVVLGGSGAAVALGVLSPGRFRKARGEPATIPSRALPPDPMLPAAVVARGTGGASGSGPAPDPASLVRAAIDRAGGIGRFVRPGEAVLIKPNMAWDRTPEQGANTHPGIVAEVVRLCREARAGRVIVADVPVHDARRCAARSGIEEAARRAGAEFVIPPGAGFVTADLRGSVLGRWEVFAPALAADRLINLPIVKDHALSRITCGLKNLYGFLGGNRGQLHQRIHMAIADLGAAFQPTLTVVDATRVMMRGGPQGGRMEDVAPVGAVAAGTDPVALDAWAARLLGVDPRDVDHIVLAEGKGIGRLDAPIEEIHVGA